MPMGGFEALMWLMMIAIYLVFIASWFVLVVAVWRMMRAVELLEQHLRGRGGEAVGGPEPPQAE